MTFSLQNDTMKCAIQITILGPLVAPRRVLLSSELGILSARRALIRVVFSE